MHAGKIQSNTMGLIAIASIVIITITLSNSLIRGLRVDLTENSLYTLSDGTKEILSAIEEPINLYFFFSKKAAQDLPFLSTYSQRIQELLLEFQQQNPKKLNVIFTDPLPFSEDEDRATGFGLQGVNLSIGDDALFMGLAGTNAIGNEVIIPIFDPNKETFLEYDLAKLIYELANPKKRNVAILSTLPINGNFDPISQQIQPDWVFLEQLDQLYKLQYLEPNIQAIDSEIEALILIHPKELGVEAEYAIDQFVLRGGKLIVFADPWSDTENRITMGQPMGGSQISSSNLNSLLEAWGVKIPEKEIVGDAAYALQVQSANGIPTRHLAMLGLQNESIDKQDIITANLESINIGYSGHIKILEDAKTKFTPLLVTSNQSSILPAALLNIASQDPSILQQGFQPTGENYVIAGRISGNVKSAFPEAIKDSDKEEHLLESSSPINILVIADTDLLSDRFWVQQQNFFGQRLVTPFANNGDFINNALDNILGSKALIGVRGRPTFNRPFTRVENLSRRAEDEYRIRELMLQQELTETENRLGELQAEEGENGALILSSEQQTELQRFQDERLRIRKELRLVQRNLRSDIEGLGNNLKILNIVLIPLIFSFLSIGLNFFRRSYKTSHHG
ncbi:MAG: Gldg family protein [Pseudomonadota bacterium]|nr:Gldg family protein [Pseudomonadota bacterium]